MAATARDASPRLSIYLLDLSGVGLSDEESTIERERIHTKNARALDAVLQDRGPAGSSDFWQNVRALMELSRETFIPRFVANHTEDLQYHTWPLHYRSGYAAVPITQYTAAVSSAPFDARQNVINILRQINDVSHTSSPEYRRLIASASRLDKDDTLDELAKILAEDLSNFKE
jgi:hypothetical protein